MRRQSCRLCLGLFGRVACGLAERGLPLLVRVGSALPVLVQLHSEFAYTDLLSHEETGPGWSYQRDLGAVAAWCKSASIKGQEFSQTGVIRRLGSRAGWASFARTHGRPAACGGRTI